MPAQSRRIYAPFARSRPQWTAVRGQLSQRRDEPDAVRAPGDAAIQAFMREALPDAPAPARARALAGDLVTTTLSTVGKHSRRLLAAPARSGPTPTRWQTCCRRTSGRSRPARRARPLPAVPRGACARRSVGRDGACPACLAAMRSRSESWPSPNRSSSRSVRCAAPCSPFHSSSSRQRSASEVRSSARRFPC